MKLSYIRFELAHKGIRQNIGLISGMEEAGIYELDAEWMKDAFDENLEIPPYGKWAEEEKTRGFASAFFTRAGYRQFEDAIHLIINEVKELGNEWEVIAIERESFPEQDIVYQDELQVVVFSDHAKGLAPYEPVMELTE